MLLSEEAEEDETTIRRRPWILARMQIVKKYEKFEKTVTLRRNVGRSDENRKDTKKPVDIGLIDGLPEDHKKRQTYVLSESANTRR